MNTQEKPIRDYLVWAVSVFVFLLVIGWVFFAYRLVVASNVCMPTHPNANLVARYLACRDANEIGDFLAGFFAPVATLLVGLAVFLQMRELKAQQTELFDTRKVFEEQSDLMKEQILEAKRSADLFAHQNSLFEKQEQDRIKAKAEESFRENLTRLEILIRTRLIGKEFLTSSELALNGKLINEQGSLLHTVDLELPTETVSAIGAFVSDVINRANERTNYALFSYVMTLNEDDARAIDIAIRLSKDTISLADSLGGGRFDDLITILRLKAFCDLLVAYRSGAYSYTSDEVAAVVERHREGLPMYSVRHSKLATLSALNQ